MSEVLVPATRPALLASVLFLGLVGCARTAAQPTPPAEAAGNWVEAALLGEVEGDAPRLESLARGDAAARVIRLDRLLDLFDAARFAEDEYARETLWQALGGHPAGIGTAATREAIGRMLSEALAIEESGALDRRQQGGAPLLPAHRQFLADAIMLLSTDLQQPATADDLSIQTLAYRQLALRGHPRLVDNARWRLYDHVRGTLTGATEVSPQHRLDVAVQSLYVQRESVEPWLQDAAPHAKPPVPEAEALLELLEVHREALSQSPRWAPVVQLRAKDDAILERTVQSVLPAARDPDWPLLEVPRGTGKPESWAPVLVATTGKVTVDAGRPQARTLPLTPQIEDVASALQTTLAQDGRGVLLVAAEPTLPSSELHALFRAVRRAQTSRLELAVAEPRIDSEGLVVMALPLEVARSADATAGMHALAQSRVAVHLTGRGPRFAVDRRWLTEELVDPSDLPSAVRTIRAAYPRVPIVRLTTSSDVAYQQLIDLLVALEGGTDASFPAVGWLAGGAAPAGEPKAAHDDRVRRRASLFSRRPAVELDQPYPFREADQKRLESFARAAAACLPELETKLDRSEVRVRASFEQGRLAQAELVRPRAAAAHEKALIGCIEDEALSLRLREHRDAVTLTVIYTAPEP